VAVAAGACALAASCIRARSRVTMDTAIAAQGQMLQDGGHGWWLARIVRCEERAQERGIPRWPFTIWRSSATRQAP
jgi:hypothetical protein